LPQCGSLLRRGEKGLSTLVDNKKEYKMSFNIYIYAYYALP